MPPINSGDNPGSGTGEQDARVWRQPHGVNRVWAHNPAIIDYATNEEDVASVGQNTLLINGLTKSTGLKLTNISPMHGHA